MQCEDLPDLEAVEAGCGMKKPMRHIVALSGGKDSTCLALHLKETRPAVDFTYVCTPTGDELPEMVDHWTKLEGVLGKPIISLTDLTLKDLVRKHVMLPNFRARFCTVTIKIAYFQKWLVENTPATVYIGLRADEENREGGIYNIPDVVVEYPLRDAGMGKSDVIQFLADRGIAIPVRTDCARCFFQTLTEWWRLWKYNRHIFEDAIQDEAFVSEARGKPCTYRSPQRDTWPAGLAELGAEFEKGRVPKNRQGVPADKQPLGTAIERDTMCTFCSR